MLIAKLRVRRYVRDIILGVNDGLVSMFLLIVGIVGGGVSARDALLTGITGAIAGAISMALGEFVATKSQAEVLKGDLDLEKEHFKYHRHIELEQVETTLEKDLNLKGDVLKAAVAAIGSSDAAMLKFMQAFEFGFTEEDERSPLVAMLMSGCLFLLGAAPTVIPFACTTDTNTGLLAACIACAIALFIVGAAKTSATRTNWVKAGLEVIYRHPASRLRHCSSSSILCSFVGRTC